MKKKKVKLSNRSIALLAAAALLFAGGTITGTRAALSYQSQSYQAEFYVNHLQVHLLENGEDICGGQNDLNGKKKVTGRLATSLGYNSENELGKVEAGKVYQEEIAVENGQDIDEFVRMTVRKYWVKTNEDGSIKKAENGDPIKETSLSPDLIHLTYGKYDKSQKSYDQYNKSAWQRNDAETTEESATYYLKEVLPGATNDPDDKISDLLFDRVMIDGMVAKAGEVTETKKDGYTYYTYEYDYDGTAFFIEAEVQAIQTHHANDAIKSQWGVGNVTVDGSSLNVEN